MTQTDNSRLNLPELASLEEAQLGIPSGLCLFGCVPLIGAIIWLIVTHNLMSLLIVAASIGAMLLTFKLLCGEIAVNEKGISYLFPLRKRFIAWPDVIGAYTIFNRQGCTKAIVIRSNSVKIRFSAFGLSSGQVEASIRQHLSRYGKARGFILSDDALSIWAEIPEDIPYELDYLDNAPDDAGGPRSYELRKDYVSQSGSNPAIDKTLIRWDDVIDVHFSCEDEYGSMCMLIESQDSNQIYIRDLSSPEGKYLDEENARFLLAVIRNARKADAGPAIAIPRGLRERYSVKLPAEFQVASETP